MSPARPAGYRSVRFGPLEVGGLRPVVCVPIVATVPEDVPAQAAELTRLAPDLLEWRADYLGDLDPARAPVLLADLRRATPLPILATVRAPAEGGQWKAGETARLDLLAALAGPGGADAVDVEAATGPEAIRQLRASLDGRPLVVSWHDFDSMPSADDLVQRATDMAALGADIAKLVAMARTPADGLDVLRACDRLTAELPVPFILIAMGAAGAYTRAVAPLLGSALTFAAGQAGSAPGQFDPTTLREMLRVFGALGS